MFKSVLIFSTLLLLCPGNFDAVENIEIISYNTTSNNSEELKDINEVITIFFIDKLVEKVDKIKIIKRVSQVLIKCGIRTALLQELTVA